MCIRDSLYSLKNLATLYFRYPELNKPKELGFELWEKAWHAGVWSAADVYKRQIYNHADFRFLSRRVLEQLSHYQDRNVYLRGIIPLLGFPSTTVDDIIRERDVYKRQLT